MKALHIFCIAVGLLLTTGCAEDSLPSQAESTADVQQKVGGCGHADYMSAWANEGGATAIVPIANYVCWLTKSGGRFDGLKGSNVGVSVEPHNDGYWWLVSRAKEEYGEAHCLPRSCFSGDGVNDVVWVSTSNYSAIAVATSTTSCDADSAYAWWGDAATMEQAWPGGPGPGRTSGGGEFVEIQQSISPTGSSVVRAGDCQTDGPSNFIRSHGTSLFVGTPSGGKAAHFSAAGSVWGTYISDTHAYVDESICYFTHIQGKFRGGGEFVKFYQQLEASSGRYKWMLQTSQGSAGGDVLANFRCYFLHQWDL